MTSLKSIDHNANHLLTPAFRLGVEHPSFADFEAPLNLGHPVDLDALRVVVDEVPRRYTRAQSTDADVWLAPRLHHSLRLSRREAAQRGMWRWLGTVFVPDYVRWRWGSPSEDSNDVSAAATEDRFVGPDYKHAVARLWWMAELFRDGPDYGPVASALANQDIPNNLFRMDIAHHRPTVQAAVKVLRGRSGRAANALAKAINSAATTLIIDTISPDSDLDSVSLVTWLSGEVDPGLYLDEMPPGPPDRMVDPAAVETMVFLLEELLREAPIRGRGGEMQ
jgi:hypothetical protein